MSRQSVRPLTVIEQTHALAFARAYAELAASCHAEAAACVAMDMRTPASRLQSDAAHFAAQARKYRLLLIGADPE